MNPSRKVRRLQSRLYTSGIGIILFSLWSFIRQAGILFEQLIDLQNFEEEMMLPKVAYTLIAGVILIIIIGTALLYIYIGRRAMLVSQGRYKKNKYLVLAILVLIISTISYGSDIATSSVAELVAMRGIVLYAIDLTSNLILLEVIIYSILLKKAEG